MDVKQFLAGLQSPCAGCDGEGKTRHFGLYDWHTETCNSCHGLGTVPTEDGEAFLAFLRQHLKVETKLG